MSDVRADSDVPCREMTESSPSSAKKSSSPAAVLVGLAAVGVVLSVLGAFFWCQDATAIFASLVGTAGAAAVAAALLVEGAIARSAAALAVGSVVGTAALVLTVLALWQSGCQEIS